MSLEGRGGSEVILLKNCSEDVLLSSAKKKSTFLIIITKIIFPSYQATLQAIVFQKRVFPSLKGCHSGASIPCNLFWIFTGFPPYRRLSPVKTQLSWLLSPSN